MSKWVARVSHAVVAAHIMMHPATQNYRAFVDCNEQVHRMHADGAAARAAAMRKNDTDTTTGRIRIFPIFSNT